MVSGTTTTTPEDEEKLIFEERQKIIIHELRKTILNQEREILIAQAKSLPEIAQDMKELEQDLIRESSTTETRFGVEPADLLILRHLSYFIQDQIFVRYQMRQMCKISVSILLFVVIMDLRDTKMVYSTGFPRVTYRR